MILIVTERAAFLSSIGAVMTLSILFTGAWDAVKKRDLWLRGAILIALVLYLGLNLYVLAYRSIWFGKAADLNHAVLEQLQRQTEDLQTGAKVLLAALPDHIQHVFAFRNTFPAAVELLQYRIGVIPVLDTELRGKSAQQQKDYVNQIAQEAGCERVFWYSDGRLILQPSYGEEMSK